MNGAVQPAGVPTKPTKLNHNVRVLLVYATILSIFSSLVTQTPLAAYILIIRGRSASVGLLVAIASSPEPRLVPALYLLRAWLMNSTFGLTKSILNDFVPKKERGKWNSLESVNLFSWSGSAMLGGYLIDTACSRPPCYVQMFTITASVQALSILCLVPLVGLVPIETRAAPTRRGSSHGTSSRGGSGGGGEAGGGAAAAGGGGGAAAGGGGGLGERLLGAGASVADGAESRAEPARRA